MFLMYGEAAFITQVGISSGPATRSVWREFLIIVCISKLSVGVKQMEFKVSVGPIASNIVPSLFMIEFDNFLPTLVY